MDNDTLDSVISGSVDRLIPLPKRVVRLFISSTFTDMTLERNSLMERVYPKLKNYCREQHGLDFQVVDMRWGVRDEATDDHQTVNLCSREIRNCQRMSLGPNFVALIGDKYGFRPLCNRIKSTEYRSLRRCLIELDINTDFLDTWYKEDLNAVPAEYLLQPISSILKNFTNRTEPELQSVDQRIWLAIQERIHELLLIGSSRLVSQGRLSEEEQSMRYSISVTEREVIEGCLDVSDAKQRCLVYVRSIRDLREHLHRCLDNLAAFTANPDSPTSPISHQMLSPSSNGTKSGVVEPGVDGGSRSSDEGARRQSESQPRRASLKIGSDSINLTTSQSQNAAERKVERTRKLLGRYIDMIAENNVWRMDEAAQSALKELKERKLTSKLRLNGRNLNKFEVDWQEQDGMSLKSEEHKKYLNELTEHFYQSLSSMIRKSARSSEQQQLKSSGLLAEVLQHSHYARHVSKAFAGRTKELAQVQSYILSKNRHVLPMFIYGVGGSGKTSFLAKSATLVDDWLRLQQEEEEHLVSSSREPAISQLPCVISRFCGTTPSSSSMVGVLGSVCRQLQYNFYQFGPMSGATNSSNDDNPEAQLPFGPIPDDFVRLVFSFRQLLDNCRHKLHRRRLFVIILDSLEHLSPPADRCSVEVKYSWLTSLGRLPSNVRLVVSCSSESNVSTAWWTDFVYLKRHFLMSHFSTHQDQAEFSAAKPCEANTQLQHLEQRLVEKCKSSNIEVGKNRSRVEERLHSLRLITISAVRFKFSSSPMELKSDGDSIDSDMGEQDVPRILHIKPLGTNWARRVLQNWLAEAGRNLTQQQWSIVDKSFASCSRPIFIKLAFGEVINWKSYSMQSDTRGLTFGSSLLEKQRMNQVSDADDDHHLSAALARLSAQTQLEQPNDELFRWQIICMEQEWLNYLEYISREENKLRNGDESEAKNQMTIRINATTDKTQLKSPSAGSAASGFSSSSSICHLSTTIDDAICQLFARIEIQHGFLLTKHSLSYLTAARNGICENELEDLLSLDDVVLDDVFQYHLPPVRRIPPLLWTRIRSDLPDYLSERDADGTFVVNWHHGQFRSVTQRRYLSEQSANDRQQVVYIHSMMADYFLGKWADKPKPFKCTKQQAQMAAEQLESAIQQSLRDSQTFTRRGSGVGNQDIRTSGAAGRHRLGSFGASYGGAAGRGVGSSISVHNRLRAGSNQTDQRFQWMQAKADRRVPHQPLYFNTSKISTSATEGPDKNEGAENETEAQHSGQGGSGRRYNLRKLTELPHHLIKSGRFLDLANEVLFNYKWLFCSLDALGLQNVLSDFDNATRAICQLIASRDDSPIRSLTEVAADDSIAIEEEGHGESEDLAYLETLRSQICLLSSAIRLSCGSITHGQTRMLAPQLLGRLLPVLGKGQQVTKHLSQLLDQCDRDGCLDNALLPVAHCLQSPEGLQSSSLEGHSFAVMAMALTNDQRHLLAVSNKFIMWDISTGEMSRLIEPKIEGSIMRALRLGADNKYALAYTSNNLVLLLDILTQQVVYYRKLSVLLATLGDDDSIRGLELIDRRGATHFMVWTRSRWFTFSVHADDQVSSASHHQQRLSIKFELCAELAEFSNLSEPSRQISFLHTVESSQNKYLLVIGTRLSEVFRISTFTVIRHTDAWSLELWSDRIDDVAAFGFNESLRQIVFMDSTTNQLYLRRRRQCSWSRAKQLSSHHPAERVLSLQMYDSRVSEDILGKRQDLDLIERLRNFERTVDDIDSTNAEIKSSSVLDEADSGQTDSSESSPSNAVVVLYETSVAVIRLGEKNQLTQLHLPKDVRNIQIEPNQCQMESLLVCDAANNQMYLVLSLNRKLLFYSLAEGRLLDSVEAHAARIVKIMAIRGTNKDECLIASASMDKSVKIWNLSNLSKNSPSLDRLDSPIESLSVSSQTGLAICLGRNECAIFDWRSLKIMTKLSPPAPDTSRMVRCGLSSNGRYLCLATLSSLYVYTLTNVRPESRRKSPTDQMSSFSLASMTCFKLYDLRAICGLVRRLVFFQQDSRLLVTIVCFSHGDDDDDDDENDQEKQDTATKGSSVSRQIRLSRRVLVLCFTIPDGRLMYTIDHSTPNLMLSHQDTSRLVQSRSKKSSSNIAAGDVRLPVLARDQAHIVTVEFALIGLNAIDKREERRRRTSSMASDRFLPLQLNVYSSRDGKLSHFISLSELEINKHQASSRRDSSLDMLSATASRKPQPRGCISIPADHFTKLKAIQYLDRQSMIALIEPTKGLSYIVDLHTRQLMLSSSSWNGTRLTSDGRYGLSGGLQPNKSFQINNNNNNNNNKGLLQRHGDHNNGNQTNGRTSVLQLLEMRQCTPLRSLLTSDEISSSSSSRPSLQGRGLASDGSSSNVLCGFNWPSDTYVYYCDQGRRRILLIRVADGKLVANYSLGASSLRRLKWADDGFVLVAGLDDGSLLSLAVVDPNNSSDSSSLARLSHYPSRKRVVA